MLILLLLLLLLLLLIQGQHCWRSRSPSATEPTRCTIGPATARRWATALGAACYATTSPSLFGRCKKFPVAKLLSSIACSDVRFLTPFLYTMQQPLGAQSRGWNLTSYWEPETCCLNVWWCIVSCYELSDAELVNCDWYFSPECWVMFRDLKSNGLSGQIPDEIGDCSLLETLWVGSSFGYAIFFFFFLKSFSSNFP